MENRNPNVENSTVELQNRTTKQRSLYKCDGCEYTTTRKFNLNRHKKRIHGLLKNPYLCCKQKLFTKAEIYLHCDKYHPKKRLNAIVSKEKYKILATREVPEYTIIYSLSKEQIKELDNKVLYHLGNVDFDTIPRAQ